VIATGKAPDGTPYEIVAYRTDEPVAGEADRGATCIFVDFPTEKGPSGGSCGDKVLSVGKKLLVSRVSGSAPGGPPANPQVTGYVSPDVAKVTVKRVGSDEPTETADLAILDGDLRRRIGAEAPIGFFLAFLPTNFPIEELRFGGEALEVSALDSSGQLVARERVSDVRTPEFRDPQRAVERAQANAPLSAVDCRAIAQALTEVARDPHSLEFHGSSCPTLDQMRSDLARNPDLQGIIEVPGPTP
jgi:hypothetical protein